MRLLLGTIILVLVTAFAMAPASAQRSQYTLDTGDQLQVTVFGHEDLSGEFQVDGAGRIGMPLVGDIMVLNLTVQQAEQAIADKLSPDFLRNPRVSVQVTNYRPFYILGEVREPGSYPYVSGMTVVQAVALAGGFTYRARQNQVRVLRGGDPSRTREAASQDTIILPGDIIEVPERFF